MDIRINCCLCSEVAEVSVETPSEWITDDIEVDNGFCPKHAIVADFESSQCRGCVGSWGECGLWRSFAYSDGMLLTSEDMESIRRGVCPKRVNGFFTADTLSGTITDCDLSERAQSESGIALAEAILGYVKEFHEGDNRE